MVNTANIAPDNHYHCKHVSMLIKKKPRHTLNYKDVTPDRIYSTGGPAISQKNSKDCCCYYYWGLVEELPTYTLCTGLKSL